MHITITSSTHKRAPRADLMIPCAHLPNPHQVPGLRPRDGRNPLVRDWLLAQPGVTDFITRQVSRVLAEKPTTITTTCTAGKHRSVMIAEALAQELTTHGHTTTVTHRELDKPKQPRRDKDPYGWKHQKKRRVVRALLQDGTPCWWCGRPMYRTHDIHADHAVSVKNGGTSAARPLHGPCNEQRREGGPDIDRRRPAGNAPDAYRMLPIRLRGGGVDNRFPAHDVPRTPPEPFTANSPFTWG